MSPAPATSAGAAPASKAGSVVGLFVDDSGSTDSMRSYWAGVEAAVAKSCEGCDTHAALWGTSCRATTVADVLANARGSRRGAGGTSIDW